MQCKALQELRDLQKASLLKVKILLTIHLPLSTFSLFSAILTQFLYLKYKPEKMFYKFLIKLKQKQLITGRMDIKTWMDTTTIFRN